MLVLAIDTSSAIASVAVVRAASDPWRAAVLAESAAELANAAGERLVGVIERVLGDAAIELSAIETFAVGVGPGSFTGTRVGVATAKGIAIAAARPLRGVNAFDALAVDAGARPGERVLVAIDARKAEVYAALVSLSAEDVAPLSEARHLAPARVPEAFALDGVSCAVGDGAALVPGIDALLRARIAPRTPRAAAVGALAGARQLRASCDEVDVLEPFYVRPPDVTMPKSPPGMPARRG